MLRVRNVEGFNLVPYLPTSPKYSLSYSQSAVLLVSFSIVFTASPSTAHPKMVKLCNHTAQASSHHACTEDGNLKRPHPPIMDGDNWMDWWLVVGWIWGWQIPDTRCT
jgi:hypothetical protein